jgi:hypothetical protein
MTARDGRERMTARDGREQDDGAMRKTEKQNKNKNENKTFL